MARPHFSHSSPYEREDRQLGARTNQELKENNFRNKERTKKYEPKTRPNNGEDPGGEILADAKVNKSIYDSKKIGDEFCFEN